ncbi:hypothetical protein XENOCAPTIV_000683, partial [Xenoophorus captivus]
QRNISGSPGPKDHAVLCQAVALCYFLSAALWREGSPQTVSYAQFLYPTNALVRQKSISVLESCTAQTPQCRVRANGQKGSTAARPNSGTAQDPCEPMTKKLLTNPQNGKDDILVFLLATR